MATNGHPGPLARWSRPINSSYAYLQVMPDRLAREEDFARVCRICAVITTNLVNLFGGDGLRLALVDKINKYLPIKVEKYDGLPQSICGECHEAVMAWDELGKQALLADTIMRRRLQILSPVKIEKPSATAGTTSKDGKYVDVGTDPRPPCPQRFCSYCPLWLPARDYNSHLIDAHAQRVFRCEECHSYLDKNDLIFHMTHHALTLPQSEDENDNADNDDSNMNEPQTHTTKTEVKDMKGVMAAIQESYDQAITTEDMINGLYERLYEIGERNTNRNNQNNMIKEDGIKRETKREQPEIRNNREQVHADKENGPTENQVKKYEDNNSNGQRDDEGVSVSNKTRDDERKEIRITPKTENHRLKSHLDAVISRIIQFSPMPLTIPQGLNLEIKSEPPSRMQSRPEPSRMQNKNKETRKILTKRPKRRKIETSIKKYLSDNINNHTLREDEDDNGGDQDDDDDNEVDASKDSSKSKVSKLSKPKVKSDKSPKASRTCPICGKEYRASSSYFYHMKYFHKRSRDHECQVCGKKFGTKANLTQHASIHTGAYELECKECGKRFRSKPSLYIHEQSHGGVKRWACGQCERSFRWRTHLARHVQRHAAARGHVCATCGRGFSVRCDLLRHARTHAAAEFHCAACPLKFAQKRYLKVHMIKKHFSGQQLASPPAPAPAAAPALAPAAPPALAAADAAPVLTRS